MTATIRHNRRSAIQSCSFVWRENGGPLWAVAPTILQCQRHGWVPDPRNPARRPAIRGVQCGDQNPFERDRRFTNSLCGASTSVTTPLLTNHNSCSRHSTGASSVSQARTHNNTRWLRRVPQRNGGLLGGGKFGMQRTIRDRRRRRRAPAPTQLGGWVNPWRVNRARNPCGPDTSAGQNACHIPLQSVGLPMYHNRLNHQLQETHRVAPLLNSEQQNGGQPGEIGMPRTTQCRRCRRQVLHPTHSIGQLATRGTWSAGQNLTDWYIVGIKNVCDIRLQCGDFPTVARSHSCHREVAR
jgi:hypothetical protein